MADESSPKKSWLKKAGDRVKAFYNAVDDRLVQLRRGRHDKKRAEIVERVTALPGGAALLAMAKEHGVKIYVVAPRKIDKSKGRFSRGGGKKIIRVSNNGDAALMATTLWHELRHVEQHVARGDMAGGTTRLLDTRAQHTLSLMHEADAFTMQALMAVRQKKDGNAEYLDKFLNRGSAASLVTADFLKKTPYESFADETQFTRALFTEIMLRALPGYNSKYFEGYHGSFEKAENLESYCKLLGRLKTPPDFDGTEKFSEVYSLKYMGATSARAIASSFLHAQPQEVYETLKLIETTAEKAQQLTETEFQKARAEILKRTKSLSKAFNTASLKYPEEPRTLLREAANANRPTLRDRNKSIRAG